jgi:hypothetical protein
MNNEFVPYEQAVELKELGFDEKCYRGYDKNQMLFYSEQENGHELNYSVGMNVSAPLYQQAFRWFREKYKGVHEIVRRKDYDYLEFIGWVFIDNKRIDVNSYWIPLSYEEAELACLKKLIEIVKSK